MIGILLLSLVLTPVELQNIYCDIDDDEFKLPTNNNYETLFSIMKSEIYENRVTQYFLSKFPNSTYSTLGVDESNPPRLNSHYIYDSNSTYAELKFYYHPCRITSVVSSFQYHNNQDVKINAINDHIYSNSSKIPQGIFDAIRDVTLYSTHQK